MYFTGVYGGLVATYLVTGVVQNFIVLAFTMTAAHNMHNKMFKYVLGASSHFFDSTPVGEYILSDSTAGTMYCAKRSTLLFNPSTVGFYLLKPAYK